MFVVNDLERLEEYGFKEVGGKNAKGWTSYTKTVGKSKADQSVAILRLIVNPYNGTHENELVVWCRCHMDADAWDVKNPPVIWSFEEIGQLVRDSVVDWVENAQGSEN